MNLRRGRGNRNCGEMFALASKPESLKYEKCLNENGNLCNYPNAICLRKTMVENVGNAEGLGDGAEPRLQLRPNFQSTWGFSEP